jgi:DNA primase catalytic core
MGRQDVERVREAIDIVDLIGGYIQLRKAGKNFKALCPFHQEKTPSFYVFPETQSFYCFGCGASGDAISFLMRIEQLDFRDALERLAERAGITLSPPRPEERAEDEQRRRLAELNRLAAAWFAHVLWGTSFGEAARSYLERRGIDRPTAERFGLGYAPDAPSALARYLSQHGAGPEELVTAGLVMRRDDGSLVDRFRNRLIFPIRDRHGTILGFGGRTLGEAQPKYLNSPQTPLFDKGSVLYAIDLAEESIRQQRTAIVVEGYLDAITAHQFGYSNTVASLGTALTERQGRHLRRLAERILLALDADVAGPRESVPSSIPANSFASSAPWMSNSPSWCSRRASIPTISSGKIAPVGTKRSPMQCRSSITTWTCSSVSSLPRILERPPRCSNASPRSSSNSATRFRSISTRVRLRPGCVCLKRRFDAFSPRSDANRLENPHPRRQQRQSFGRSPPSSNSSAFSYAIPRQQPFWSAKSTWSRSPMPVIANSSACSSPVNRSTTQR